MKYFLDTEFLEGAQKKWFGQTNKYNALSDAKWNFKLY